MPTPRTGLPAALAAPPNLTDDVLIGRYVRHRDEAAFAALVRRHGRAVLGVCRRVLGNSADADDAFQATFLTLARKAHRVAFRGDAAGWLFAVAVRASREVLRRRAVRAARETVGVPDVAAPPAGDADAARVVLDEVANLSAAYRAAVVLCELDGVGRADAARRLNIPEGTLSSRLAAARKQLAARLTARGVTPVVVPFAVSVPGALAAATVAATDRPSATVFKLTEVLMRTSGMLSAGKWLASLTAVAVAVIGLSLGEGPSPPVARPPAARAVAPAAPPGRLTLTFREEVRYLTPAGKELQRIDYPTAKKADAELLSGQVQIGVRGLISVQRFLPTCGRAGPGGVVPLRSHGTRLMTPGHPPTVKLLDAENRDEDVVGWSTDGSKFLVRTRVHEGQVIGFTRHSDSASWVGVATGTRELLPFGKDHRVIDVSADGRRFLTCRSRASAAESVCLVTAEGKVLHETDARARAAGEVDPRLSPDGRRLVEAATAGGPAGPRSVLFVSEYERGNDARPVCLAYEPADQADMTCRALGWSPDGRQVVSCWVAAKPTKGQRTCHVVVCDADGHNLRAVAKLGCKADEELRSVDWW